jgi:hypothetical protein
MGVKTSDYEHHGEEDNLKTHIIYTPIEVKAQTSKGCISIYHGLSYSHGITGVKVKEDTSFLIKSNDYLNFREWHKNFIYPLQAFLSLATNRWCSVNHFRISTSLYTIKDTEIPQSFDGHFKPYQRYYSENDFIHPIFTLKDIKDDFDGIMDQWLKILEKYTAPCELFFFSNDNTWYVPTASIFKSGSSR